MSEVYTGIVGVMTDLAAEGISKDRKNTQGSGYNFRGIDDVYNALSKALSKNRLVIIPRVISRGNVERSSKSGGALFYTTVDVEFDIVSAVDGSKHTARTVGEAMDSGDKSSNKAMSAAYKYMAFQTFCIPTEGDNDADAVTHVVEPAKSTPHQRPADLKKNGAWESTLSEMEKDLLDVKTLGQFKSLRADYIANSKKAGWRQDWIDSLDDEFERRLVERKNAAAKSDPVDDIQDQFPGSRIVNETHKEAAE